MTAVAKTTRHAFQLRNGRGGRGSGARLFILIGAFASFVFSVSLWFTGSKEEGLFVGLWVPSILALGSVVLPAKR